MVADRPDAALVGAVALGGAVGSVLRHLLTEVAPTPAAGFPWATLGVNIVGSLLLGMVAGFVAVRSSHRLLHPGAGAGLLGGFTTFSTFAVQAVDRASGAPATAAAYVVATLVLATAAAALGLVLGRRAEREVPS